MNRYDSYKNSGVESIGEIPSSWTIPKMSYLLEGITDGTHGTHERVDEGELFLSSKNVTNKGIFIGENESKVTTEEHEKIVKKGYPVKGDILITVVGSIGRSCVYEYDYPISFQRSVCFLRFKETVNEYFMNFLIHSDVIQFQLLKNTKKSTQGGIYMNDLKRFDINLPPLSEQQQIVFFLDTKTSLIDSLIEKTQRKIELLKEKRTSLINEVVTKGLNPNVEMKDSGVKWIGKIPDGWTNSCVRYLTHEHRQGYYSSDSYSENGLRVVRITDLNDDRTISIEKSPFYQLSEEEKERFILRNGDFLFPRTGGVGRFGIFNDKTPSIYGSFLIRFRFSDSVINQYMRYYFDSGIYLNQILSEIHGGVNQNVHVENIKDCKIFYPNKSEQQQIVEYLDEQTQKIDKTISIEEKRIELLKEYRQSLISEVVTGKRKVVK